MIIANPLYDVVFKYVMDDNKIAKIFLSTIIGEEIVELVYKPTERRIAVEHKSITVYRIDFAAKIRTITGEMKQVLIEVQKAKFATDIMRFRKYLGEQYIDQNNADLIQEPSSLKKYKPYPLISIYFLGYKLDKTEAATIKVNRTICDLSTGQELKIKEEFIESLTHDSYIIQIPYLKESRRKTELEIVLSVFEQTDLTDKNHIKNIREEDFPEKFRELIRRLQKAASVPEVREIMDMEDEILSELEDFERVVEFKEKIIVEQEKSLKEKDQWLEEKNKKLEEKDKKLEEKDKLVEEKDRIIQELLSQLSTLNKK